MMRGGRAIWLLSGEPFERGSVDERGVWFEWRSAQLGLE